MSRLTRAQAIALVGIDAVTTVERANVDFTHRVTDGTANHGGVEFSASVDVGDQLLTMYVFAAKDAVDAVEQLDELNWGAIIDNTAEFEII